MMSGQSPGGAKSSQNAFKWSQPIRKQHTPPPQAPSSPLLKSGSNFSGPLPWGPVNLAREQTPQNPGLSSCWSWQSCCFGAVLSNNVTHRKDKLKLLDMMIFFFPKWKDASQLWEDLVIHSIREFQKTRGLQYFQIQHNWYIRMPEVLGNPTTSPLIVLTQEKEYNKLPRAILFLDTVAKFRNNN